jgi:hypoxanthine-DNA glycosylase
MNRRASQNRKIGGTAKRDAAQLVSFPPLFREDAVYLILGTMPGVESLRRGEYYAHPRNAFWPIMGRLFGAGPDLPYSERVRRLTAARVAVWDVVARCRRPGSSDAEIRDAIPNDILGLLRRAPRVRRILFNGAEAERLFRRFWGSSLDRAPLRGIEWIRLPSTSPAHATRSLDEKSEFWRRILLGRQRIGGPRARRRRSRGHPPCGRETRKQADAE